VAGLPLLAALSLRAQNYAETHPRGFSEGDLNAALGIWGLVAALQWED
jgi:hypothetical protein